MILKRIVEPRNEIVENPLRGAFSEEERSLFIACSKAVFSYLDEKQKLYETCPKKGKKGGRGRSTYRRTADNKTHSMSDISAESSEKESDKLDYSIVAKLADPRLLGQKKAHLKLLEEILGKCIVQKMYDFMMCTFEHGKCFVIAMSIQCCTPPYFKKLGGVFPKYAAAAAYAGVESSELFQIFVPCTRFAILYIFVKSKLWQLIRTIFNVLDNRFMIIVSKTFSLK